MIASALVLACALHATGTSAATLSLGGTAINQQSGSTSCSYTSISEDATGNWSVACGAGTKTIQVVPAINGTQCVTYSGITEDASGAWAVSGCVSAGPTLTLDAPAISGATYQANGAFTLKATAVARSGRTISSVDFLHDGIPIHSGAPSGGQYAFDWAPPAGTYSVVAQATDSTGAVTVTSPVQMIFSNTAGVFYIHADHLGTPREITRASDNQIMWRWDNTEAFGNSAPNENPSGLGSFAYNLRFPGQYFDSETGTNYNYFRDYDASIGRYVQSDPIGLEGGPNTYAYVENKPLISVDPTGEINVPGALLGMGIEVAVQLYQNDGRFECIDLIDVAIATGVGIVAPGLWTAGKNVFRSFKAIQTLTKQIDRAQTANRLGKIQGRIEQHRTSISDNVIIQGGYQGAKQFGKAVSDNNGSKPCPKDCP